MLSKLSKLIYLIHFHNRTENGQNLTKILQLLDIDWSSGWSIFCLEGMDIFLDSTFSTRR